jgi:hypothetical protein
MRIFALSPGARLSRKATWGIFAEATRRADVCPILEEGRFAYLHAPPARTGGAEHHPRQARANHETVEVLAVGYLSGVAAKFHAGRKGMRHDIRFAFVRQDNFRVFRTLFSEDSRKASC